MLANHAVRNHRVVVVVKIELRLVVASLVTASGSSQSIELGSGIELSLRLHERRTVISHELVTGIRVLAEENDASRDDDHQKEDEREGGIENKENNTDNTADHRRGAKDIGEDQDANGVNEVDSVDSDVERVGGLVHPGAEYGSRNQGSSLKNDEANGLSNAAALSESHEHTLDKGVDEHGHDEVVGRGAELDVQETPLVESLRVREQDVGRVAVHGNRAASDANDLAGSPGEGGEEAEEEHNGKHDDSGRVNLGELPEAKDGQRGEAEKSHAEEDALEDSEPSIAELLELLGLHPSLLSGKLENALESGDREDGSDDEDAEEDQASQDKVGSLNLGAECNTLDTEDNEAARSILDVATLDKASNRRHGQAALEELDAGAGNLETTLLDLNRGSGERVENR